MCSTLFAAQLLCGVHHDLHTGDFSTYYLRLPPRDCAPLVMQLAGPDPSAAVATYVRSGRAAQVALLHEALRQAVDVPLFVPVPQTRVPVSPLSALVLATASESGRLDEDEVVALCNVVHVPVSLDPRRHVSLDPRRHQRACTPPSDPRPPLPPYRFPRTPTLRSGTTAWRRRRTRA